MIYLDAKIALVTGGTRGIGAACSRLFVQAGAKVAMSYQNNASAAEKLLGELREAGGEAIAVAGDLSRETEADRLVAETLAAFGRIDILVNNHGIWPYGAIDTMPTDVWLRAMDVNLNSVMYVTRAVARQMKAQKSGTIINISSTAGQRGEAFHSHYAATKGAVISLTKSWSTELAPDGITVNCVAPGWVDTEMCDEVFADAAYREQVRIGIPIGRIPPPEDIAGPVLFLASPLARHITGEILNVNGGSVLCG